MDFNEFNSLKISSASALSIFPEIVLIIEPNPFISPLFVLYCGIRFPNFESKFVILIFWISTDGLSIGSTAKFLIVSPSIFVQLSYSSMLMI